MIDIEMPVMETIPCRYLADVLEALGCVRATGDTYDTFTSRWAAQRVPGDLLGRSRGCLDDEAALVIEVGLGLPYGAIDEKWTAMVEEDHRRSVANREAWLKACEASPVFPYLGALGNERHASRWAWEWEAASSVCLIELEPERCFGHRVDDEALVVGPAGGIVRPRGLDLILQQEWSDVRYRSYGRLDDDVVGVRLSDRRVVNGPAATERQRTMVEAFEAVNGLEKGTFDLG